MSSAIEFLASLEIGSVDEVAPNRVVVSLSIDAPSSTALNTGVPMRFPKINGYVVIPSGSEAIVGLVTWIGVFSAPFPKRSGYKDFGLIDLPFPLRKMSILPVGMLRSRGSGEYVIRRGVTSLPSVGDPVLLPPPEVLRGIIERPLESAPLEVGTAPLAGNAAVRVHPNDIFGRHLAVLGNTGSGKSCTVAGLIHWSIDAARSAAASNGKHGIAARFVVLDPNGEYRKSFEGEDHVRVLRADASADSRDAFELPAWMWDSEEWASFANASPGVQRPLLKRSLRLLKSGGTASDADPKELAMATYMSTLIVLRSNAPHSGEPKSPLPYTFLKFLDKFDEDLAVLEGTIEPEKKAFVTRLISTVTGVRLRVEDGRYARPFSVAIVQELVDELKALLVSLGIEGMVYSGNEDAPMVCNIEALPDLVSNLAQLESGNAAAYVESMTSRLREMFARERLRRLIVSTKTETAEAWLSEIVSQRPWEDENGSNVTVIDLSLVPSDVVHIVVAAASRIIFEAAQRYRRIRHQELPIVLVLEEAHTFVKRREDRWGDETTYADVCRAVFERIAREGRKFGLGLVLSSQRPAELSPTVLAQCNTYIVHRLVNDRDQELVRRLVPDNAGDLLSELPSLPQQQAIMLGSAVEVPVLMKLRDLEEERQPESSTPRFWEVWTREEQRDLDWKVVVNEWLGQRDADEQELRVTAANEPQSVANEESSVPDTSDPFPD